MLTAMPLLFIIANEGRKASFSEVCELEAQKVLNRLAQGVPGLFGNTTSDLGDHFARGFVE
jgi:hypothetical protein